MAISKGVIGKMTMQVVRGTSVVSTPCASQITCPWDINVFGGGSNDLENDKWGDIIEHEPWVSAVVWKIEELQSGSWVAIHTVDGTYGTYQAFGAITDMPLHSSFLADFDLMYGVFGQGIYRFTQTETTPLGSNVLTPSPEFCLYLFDCALASTTCRVEWYLNNYIGDINNDRKAKYFGSLNWYGQFRIPNAIFGYATSEYDTEETQFQTGQLVPTNDIQTQSWTLTLEPAPDWFHNLLKTDILQAGQVQFTDYNATGPNQNIIRKRVRRTGAYAPEWHKGQCKARVVVELKDEFSNLEVNLCQ